jgi:hypothetical protein
VRRPHRADARGGNPPRGWQTGVGLDTTFHVHVILQSKHRLTVQLKTFGVVHVTNLKPPGSDPRPGYPRGTAVTIKGLRAKPELNGMGREGLPHVEVYTKMFNLFIPSTRTRS